MTDGEAILAAVLASPADDAPRLVYADWLDEHAGGVLCDRCRGVGRTTTPAVIDMDYDFVDDCRSCSSTGYVSNGLAERAEFIRVQVQLARLGPPRRSFDVDYGTWAFHKGVASLAILQNQSEPPIVVGERINIRLTDVPQDEPTVKLRSTYYGMLVIDAQRLFGAGVAETYVEARMDPGSTEWEGEALKARERELLLNEAGAHKLAGCFRWEGFETALVYDETNPLTFYWYAAEKIGFQFSRGFVETIACQLKDAVEHLDKIVAMTPLREVTLTETDGQSMFTLGTIIGTRLGWPMSDTRQVDVLIRDAFKALWNVKVNLPEPMRRDPAIEAMFAACEAGLHIPANEVRRLLGLPEPRE